MEVVVRTKGQFYAFVKGALETIQERLNNLPALYVSTYKLYTRQGSHVQALTYKPLPDMTELDREIVEGGLKFDGLADKGDVGMKPEGDDVVEGHGEAEVGSDSDGELQEVDQE
ncbi:probable manganese-transporting ATPase PDR2, partial [Tanacetum coccineum]